MKLQIRLSGLFMYTKRRAGHIVVLAPTTGFQIPFEVEKHEAVMQIYTAYRRGTGSPNSAEYGWMRLENRSLEIRGDRVAKPRPPFGKLAKLDGITKTKLRPELFGRDPGGRLASRLILDGGQQLKSHEGATFELAGVPGKLTSEIFWEMEIPGNSLELKATMWDGSVEEIETLSTDQPAMCLTYFYVPRGHLPRHDQGHEKPEPPPPETPISHFMALYGLYKDLIDLSIPVYKGGFEQPQPPGSWCILGISGGDPVTCVGGTGDE